MLANDYFVTPIARFATRPGGSGNIDKWGTPECVHQTPDLIMGTLMKSGAHLLKSDTIYEMVMNELTGVIELREKGQTSIGKWWGRAYYDIPMDMGSRCWLSKDELAELDKDN